MQTLKTLIIMFCIMTFLSCGGDNSKKNSPDIVDGVVKTDTIFKSPDSLIIRTNNSVDTLVRFTSKLNDSSYFVKFKDIKTIKNLDFSKYEFKKMFITRTKEGVEKQGVNFAGHYCFVSWGCGSPCKLSAVVDMQTGMVYNGIGSEIGYEFKKDSKVLIINPPDSMGFYNNRILWQRPSQYIWTGRQFEKI